MKTFVINLERSTIRRASIQKQLDEQGIDFEFIKAVDGALLTDEYLAKVCNFEELAKRPHIQHKGMYGCILSHYYIYEKIVANKLPYALILEDDVVIQAGIKAVLAELETKIQANEAILLFTQNNFMPTVLSEQNSETLPGKHRLSYPMEPWALGSTAGYIISQAAAKGMLNYMLPIHVGPDAWITFYRDKAISSLRCVTPFLVKPAGFTSDIDYVTKSGLMGKALAFVKEHRIFPFKQLLDFRRKRALEKSMQYSFTAEPSPVAQAQVAEEKA
jgi:glycosyl transferase family 25